MIKWHEEKNKIIHWYIQENKSLRWIADELNSTHTTVNKWLSRWGIERRNGRSRQRINVHDKVGETIGFLKVLAQDTSKYPTHWLCKCICGRIISINRVKLIIRKNPSCGCRRRNKNAKYSV